MMLADLLQSYNVATTALLANYWKHIAKSSEQWSRICIKPGPRQQDLFKDPYQSLFIDEHIQAEAESRLDIRMWLPLATRSRYFRKTLAQAIKTQQVEQVILLGSGFDTLAFRKKKYNCRFFEIDKPELLECKQAILTEHQIEPNATYLGMDYCQVNFIEQLLKQGFQAELNTLVLWEGNSFYLEKVMVLNIIEQIAMNIPHLILSFDFMQPALLLEEDTLNAFAEKNSAFKSFFSIDEMLECLHGLNLVELSIYSTAELAIMYQVDMQPYHTAEPYSVITVQSAHCSQTSIDICTNTP